MAYDLYLADRISNILSEKKIVFIEFKMMGGLCYKVDEKMICGLLIDKKSRENLLMARVGVVQYEKEIHKPACLPMDFTGRPMKGYLFINGSGLETDEELEYWINLCLKFNPFAKASKKRKKK